MQKSNEGIDGFVRSPGGGLVQTGVKKMSEIANKVKNVDVSSLKNYINLLKDYDIDLPKTLRELAALFGVEATLHDISVAVTDVLLPTKTIAGKEYVAGYKGTNIIPAGNHKATLISFAKTKDKTKLLFAIGSKYIYSVPGNENLESLFESVNIPNYFTIQVKHEKIENTGDLHAIATNWFLNK